MRDKRAGGRKEGRKVPVSLVREETQAAMNRVFQRARPSDDRAFAADHDHLDS